jgi:hypothetical protein
MPISIGRRKEKILIYPNTEKNRDCLIATVYADEPGSRNIKSLTLRVSDTAFALINKSKKAFPKLTFSAWDMEGIPVHPGAFHMISIEGDSKDLAGYRSYILNGEYHSLAS